MHRHRHVCHVVWWHCALAFGLKYHPAKVAANSSPFYSSKKVIILSDPIRLAFVLLPHGFIRHSRCDNFFFSFIRWFWSFVVLFLFFIIHSLILCVCRLVWSLSECKWHYAIRTTHAVSFETVGFCWSAFHSSSASSFA